MVGMMSGFVDLLNLSISASGGRSTYQDFLWQLQMKSNVFIWQLNASEFFGCG